jgi:hypothetical protein
MAVVPANGFGQIADFARVTANLQAFPATMNTLPSVQPSRPGGAQRYPLAAPICSNYFLLMRFESPMYVTG